MQHPPSSLSGDPDDYPMDSQADDAALMAWWLRQEPGGSFTDDQRLSSLLRLVAPHERAQTLRELSNLAAGKPTPF